jgi:RNA polymerase sigma factor (sigma-70 family)
MKEINELPSNQKTALILKAIDGLSQKEIAEILKLNIKAVESLLTRARINLKIKLRK